MIRIQQERHTARLSPAQMLKPAGTQALKAPRYQIPIVDGKGPLKPSAFARRKHKEVMSDE
jgi:hypothetical protein